MMALRSSAWLRVSAVALLMVSIGVVGYMATPLPLDDHFHYQAFVEALASGSLDLSIPGFHGSDFLAALWHLVSPSSLSQIQFQILCSILLPLVAYRAGKSLYGSSSDALLLTCAISMMPFVLFVGLRGWTGAAYFCLMLGSIAIVKKIPLLSGVLLGLAVLTKPFAIILLPLLLVMRDGSSRNRILLPALGLPALYIVVQLLQTGSIIVGSHPDMNALSIWQGPVRVGLNLAHAVQILFSIHNYYFPDPSLTGAGNMMHTSPVLIMLGLFALLSRERVIFSRSLQLSLILGAAVGILMNALLDHMDHFYMEASVLLLVIASIYALKKWPVWIPIALATLHFQWFYFFLEFGENFSLGWWFFLTPFLIDLYAAVWVLSHYIWKH